MVWIRERETTIRTEPPENITADNVQYWCRHSKELKNTQVSKALKFLRYDCLRYLGEAFKQLEGFKQLRGKYPEAKHIFICLPLNTKDYHEFLGVRLEKKPYEKDYNSSEYIIYKRKDGTFECNCQGYQSKKRRGEIIPEGANCSHILALFYAFKIRRFGKKQGAEEELMRLDRPNEI